MEDPSDAPKPDKSSKLPPPLKPSNVLDSIFSRNGPMPPASVAIRGLACSLDLLLIVICAFVILAKLALPAQYPNAGYEFNQFTAKVATWVETSSARTTEPKPEMSASLEEAWVYSLSLTFFMSWLYFGLGEAFFQGSSLAKRLCSIRTISTVTLGDLPIVTGIVRGGFKTLVIFLVFPFSAPVTLLGLLFNKRCQFVHDLLNRTAVVDERKASIQI